MATTKEVKFNISLTTSDDSSPTEPNNSGAWSILNVHIECHPENLKDKLIELLDVLSK